MPEGFNSIGDIKVVVDASTEKLTGGLTVAHNLIQRFAGEGSTQLTSFDAVVGKVGVGIDGLKSKLGLAFAVVETLTGLFAKAQALVEDVAKKTGNEGKIVEITGAIGDLKAAFSSVIDGHISELSQQLVGLEKDENSTAEGSKALAAVLLDKVVVAIKEVNFQIQALGPSSQQSIEVLMERFDRARERLDELNKTGYGRKQLEDTFHIIGDSVMVQIEQTNEALNNEAHAIDEMLPKLRELIDLQREKGLADSNTVYEAEIAKGVESAEKIVSSIEKEITALERKTKTLGMTASAAAAYNAENRIRDELAKADLTNFPGVQDKLSELMGQYRAASNTLDAYAEAKKRLAEIERQDKQVARVFESIDAEARSIQRKTEALMLNSAEAARLATIEKGLSEIRRTGREATDAEREAIEAHATSIGQATAAYTELSKQMKIFQDVGGVVTKGIEDQFRKFTSGAQIDVREMVRSMLADLAMLTFKQGVTQPLANLLTGGGQNGGGLLGQLFGGFRADGGDVDHGTPYIVGERGPEWFVPKGAGTVLPNGATPGGGATTVHMPISINAAGAYPESIDEIKNALRQIDGSMPGRMVEVMREVRERGL